ncbi:MAG: glycosyltransferase family 2 protein [Clostridiales bacterium]|nr:glycosyltransferase family 2 protein [Clostridiales bacterium]
MLLEEKISVIIPCYNSEKTIEIVCGQIRNTFESENIEYEIILVNDCSRDKTWDVLKRLSAQDNRIIVLNLSKNFGQHAAIMAGFREAKGDIIAGIDDDGEYNTEDFLVLLGQLKKGYDYVCGDYKRKKNSCIRNLGSKVNNYMATKFIGKPSDVNLSSLYMMKRYVVDEIIKYDKPFPYIAGLILRVTTNIANVNLEKNDRIEGKSGYNLKKLLKLWINGFTAFSILPLRIASILGIATAFLGFAFGVFIIVRKLLLPDILIGYSSLMAIIMFVGGVIMVLLGIIGEYVGRIYMCINNSPQYVISEQFGRESE